MVSVERDPPALRLRGEKRTSGKTKRYFFRNFHNEIKKGLRGILNSYTTRSDFPTCCVRSQNGALDLGSVGRREALIE